MFTVRIIKFDVHKTKCRPHSVFRCFFASGNKQLHFLMQNYFISLYSSIHPSIRLSIYLSIYLPIYLPVCLSICLSLSLYLSIYSITAVAVFRKPNSIPLCFSTDLVPHSLLPCLLVLLLSTFSLHILFFFFPVVSIQLLILVFSPLASFSRRHTIVVFSSLWCPRCPVSLSLPWFLYMFIFLFLVY